jgi:hypothetical protein
MSLFLWLNSTRLRIYTTIFLIHSSVVVVQITFFLPSARGLEFLLFDGGAGALLWLQWGALTLCELWEPGFLAPAV